MIAIVREFLVEIALFVKANWWVTLVYVAAVSLVAIDDVEHTASVVVSTSLHFIADIIIIMMMSAYTRLEYKRGSVLQAVAALLFLAAKLYTGIFQGHWHYLLADPVYVLAAVKNYLFDVCGVKCRPINGVSMFAFGLFVVFGSVVVLRWNGNAEIVGSYAQGLQMSGITLFAVALSITGRERQRHKVAVVALLAMVLGSAWETGVTFLEGEMVGLALSYTLLPLTVLVFYIKNWPVAMGASERV